MQSLFWLSENEAVWVWLKKYDQTLPDSRYLEVSSMFSHFKNFHVRIFFCAFLTQVNDVRWWGWAIFQRPVHSKLRTSVETTLFTWRPRGILSYASSFKSLKILHLFPIDVVVFFNLESIFLLEGQLSKLIQIWWHFAWAFSWERRLIIYIDSPASQGARFSFLYW